MRVTFILPSYASKPGGGTRIIYEHANRLAVRGHEISILYPKTVNELYTEERLSAKLRRTVAHYIRALLKPMPKWSTLDPRIQGLFISEPTAQNIPDADIVFSTVWAIPKYMSEYPESKGKQCYFFQHYETWSGPKDIVDATWRAPFKKIVISKWLENIGASLGATDMHYIPNGLDFERFKLINPIEGRPMRVAMMFSRAEWKGGEDGVKALSIAKKRFPDLRAVLFGVQRKSPGIPSWIEFIHNPPQDVLVKDIYNGSSIYLCSSHVEGFALPPAEAMACGGAVVTTDCGGVLDFAEHGVTALVSPPKNAELLAENLCKLLEDDNLRKKIAHAGHDNIQQFTWERSVNLMEQFMTAS